MTPENFVYWLQGYLELCEPVVITNREVESIKQHIALVLEKKTPNNSIPITPGVIFNPSPISSPTPPPKPSPFLGPIMC